MRASTVETSTARLFVYEWGDRDVPAVLYWDGLGGTGLHANEIAPILVEEFGLRVIAPDAPGHGRSPALAPDAYRPSELASLTAGLLSTLGVRRAAFVGFSWGAEVACSFGARLPERTTRLVLVDGGYWDFADLPDFDTDAGFAARVEAARRRATDDWYGSWEAYFAAESSALGRWTPALAEAHRATMREQDGRIVPILSPEVIGAIHHGNCLEPTASEHAALRASGVPILLLTPTELGGAVSSAGVARFEADVPQLHVRELPGGVHDLVSQAPLELAAIVGGWLTD